VSWSRRFDEPIPPPNGKKLRTLKDAIAWLATEVPKAEQAREHWQTATEMLPSVR